jgi:hypothetical protein
MVAATEALAGVPFALPAEDPEPRKLLSAAFDKEVRREVSLRGTREVESCEAVVGAAIQGAIAAEIIEHLRELERACRSKGAAHVAAFDYVNYVNGRASRKVTAAAFGVTSDQLRHAEKWVRPRFEALRRLAS